MTEKQRDYILILDEELIDFWQLNAPRVISETLLGKNWLKDYKKISYYETSKCIERLNEEIDYCDCRHSYTETYCRYL